MRSFSRSRFIHFLVLSGFIGGIGQMTRRAEGDDGKGTTSKVENPLIAAHAFSARVKALVDAKDDVISSYDEEDPILAIYRVDRIEFSKEKGKTCSQSVSAVAAFEIGEKDRAKAWNPFEGEELASIQNCETFPCRVKFDASEVATLKAASKDARLAKFDELVDARIRRAQSTGVRAGYERKEPAISGWNWLKARYDFGLPFPAKSEVYYRRVGLGKKGGYQEVRQAFEERRSQTANRAHVWIQDLYTDHYFDSWSEEIDLVCLSEEEGILTQTAVIEIDLLKSTDFFSKMMKGKIRHGVREAVFGMLRERRAKLAP